MIHIIFWTLFLAIAEAFLEGANNTCKTDTIWGTP